MTKTCQFCTQPFEAKSDRALYCDFCKAFMKRCREKRDHVARNERAKARRVLEKARRALRLPAPPVVTPHAPPVAIRKVGGVRTVWRGRVCAGGYVPRSFLSNI